MIQNLDIIFSLGELNSVEFGPINKEEFLQKSPDVISFDCHTLEGKIISSKIRTTIFKNGEIKQEKIYDVYPNNMPENVSRCLNSLGQSVFNWEYKNEF